MLQIASPRHLQGLYNTEEVARLAGVNRRTLDYYLRAGYIPRPSHRVGRRLYYAEAEVEELIHYFERRRAARDELRRLPPN